MNDTIATNTYTQNLPENYSLSEYSALLAKAKIGILKIRAHDYQHAQTILEDISNRIQQILIDFNHRQYYIQYGVLMAKVGASLILIHIANPSLQKIEEQTNKLLNIILLKYFGVEPFQSRQLVYRTAMNSLIGFSKISDFTRHVESHKGLEVEPLIVLSIGLMYEILGRPEISYKICSECYNQLKKGDQAICTLMVCRHLINLVYKLNIGQKVLEQLNTDLNTLMNTKQLYGIAFETLFRNYETKIQYATKVFRIFYQFQLQYLKENNRIDYRRQIWICKAISSHLRKFLCSNTISRSKAQPVYRVLQLLKSCDSNQNIRQTLRIVERCSVSSSKMSLVNQMKRQWTDKLTIVSEIVLKQTMQQFWNILKSKRTNTDSPEKNPNPNLPQKVFNKYIQSIKRYEQDHYEDQQPKQKRTGLLQKFSVQTTKQYYEFDTSNLQQSRVHNHYIAHIKHQPITPKRQESFSSSNPQSNFSRSPKYGRKVEKANIIISNHSKSKNISISHFPPRPSRSPQSKQRQYERQRKNYSPIKSEYGPQTHRSTQRSHRQRVQREDQRDEYTQNFTQISGLNRKQQVEEERNRITFSEVEPKNSNSFFKINHAVESKENDELQPNQSVEQSPQKKDQNTENIQKNKQQNPPKHQNPPKKQVVPKIILTFENPKIRKLIQLCESGQYFIKKHYTSDGGEQKFVIIDQISQMVKWGSSEDKLKSGKFQSYKIQDIKGVLYGKVSPTFLKQCNFQLKPWKCFSLILKKRTLDFYAIQDIDPYIWLPGISAVLQKNTQINKKRLPGISSVLQKNTQINKKRQVQIYSPGRVLWKRMLLKLQYLFIKPLKKGQKKSYKNANAHAIIIFGRNNLKISDRAFDKKHK